MERTFLFLGGKTENPLSLNIWPNISLGKYIIPSLLMSCLYVYSFMCHVLGREQGQMITIGCRNDGSKKNRLRPRPAPSRGQFLSIRDYIVFSVKRKKLEVEKKKERKKEKPPQDLTRLCRGAKGHLMNNG